MESEKRWQDPEMGTCPNVLDSGGMAASSYVGGLKRPASWWEGENVPKCFAFCFFLYIISFFIEVWLIYNISFRYTT